MPEPKRYYWLKLKDDFFRQKEIKQLRRIAGGDTFTIVYLKMLLRSLKDDGKLYYEGIEQNFVSELALDIDEDEDNVKVTVSFLMAKGLLIQSDTDEYELSAMNAMAGSESYSAERMRRMRDRKLLASQCDAPVTDCDGAVTDGDEEKREKREETREKSKTISADANIMTGFDDFWKVYPRHVAKQNAQRSWKSLKPNDELVKRIVADVNRRLDSEWRGKDMQYIPHPSTYLNQRRWEDETEVAKVAEHREPDPVILTDEEQRIIDEIYANGGGWG